MTLAIDTPAGKEALKEELKAAALFESRVEGLLYIHTNKRLTVAYDAIIADLENRKLVAYAETKCRDYDLKKLRDEYKMEWLITRKHLEKAYVAAKMAMTPLWGMLYLIPEKTLLMVQIADRSGRLTVPIRSQITTTSASINGGISRKMNSFINMTSAKIIQ